MLASKYMVSKLIPQGPPMIMVDGLLYHDEQKSRTCLQIESDNMFVIGDVFTEAGLIENIAQSAALRMGWMGYQEMKEGEDIKPKVGVIGAVKNFTLYQLPTVGTEINTEINIQTEIFNATIISGKITAGEELLAECEMKIFLQE